MSNNDVKHGVKTIRWIISMFNSTYILSRVKRYLTTCIRKDNTDYIIKDNVIKEHAHALNVNETQAEYFC